LHSFWKTTAERELLLIVITCNHLKASDNHMYNLLQHGANYSRRVAKYGGQRSKSSVPKFNPWCFVVAENTRKLPR